MCWHSEPRLHTSRDAWLSPSSTYLFPSSLFFADFVGETSQWSLGTGVEARAGGKQTREKLPRTGSVGSFGFWVEVSPIIQESVSHFQPTCLFSPTTSPRHDIDTTTDSTTKSTSISAATSTPAQVGGHGEWAWVRPCMSTAIPVRISHWPGSIIRQSSRGVAPLPAKSIAPIPPPFLAALSHHTVAVRQHRGYQAQQPRNPTLHVCRQPLLFSLVPPSTLPPPVFLPPLNRRRYMINLLHGMRPTRPFYPFRPNCRHPLDQPSSPGGGTSTRYLP